MPTPGRGHGTPSLPCRHGTTRARSRRKSIFSHSADVARIGADLRGAIRRQAVPGTTHLRRPPAHARRAHPPPAALVIREGEALMWKVWRAALPGTPGSTG